MHEKPSSGRFFQGTFYIVNLIVVVFLGNAAFPRFYVISKEREIVRLAAGMHCANDMLVDLQTAAACIGLRFHSCLAQYCKILTVYEHSDLNRIEYHSFGIRVVVFENIKCLHYLLQLPAAKM